MNPGLFELPIKAGINSQSNHQMISLRNFDRMILWKKLLGNLTWKNLITKFFHSATHFQLFQSKLRLNYRSKTHWQRITINHQQLQILHLDRKIKLIPEEELRKFQNFKTCSCCLQLLNHIEIQKGFTFKDEWNLWTDQLYVFALMG